MNVLLRDLGMLAALPDGEVGTVATAPATDDIAPGRHMALLGELSCVYVAWRCAGRRVGCWWRTDALGWGGAPAPDEVPPPPPALRSTPSKRGGKRW